MREDQTLPELNERYLGSTPTFKELLEIHNAATGIQQAVEDIGDCGGLDPSQQNCDLHVMAQNLLALVSKYTIDSDDR